MHIWSRSNYEQPNSLFYRNYLTVLIYSLMKCVSLKYSILRKGFEPLFVCGFVVNSKILGVFCLVCCGLRDKFVK